MRRRRIAVLGAGFSGVAVASQLLGRRGCEVLLIERGRRFGPGAAFGVRDPAWLLNERASDMSADPASADDFAHWLGVRDGQADGFAPRRRYGAYLEHVLARARRKARRSRLSTLRGEAVACRRGVEGWLVDLEGEPESVEADAVVLAMGRAPQAPPAVFEAQGVSVLKPWSAEALQPIERTQNILLLGDGQTMIDHALALARNTRMGAIYVVSRRGLMPRAHPREPARAPPEALALPAALSEALHVFRREVRAAQARGEPWQFAFARLRQRAPNAWRRLAPDAQRRFLRHLRPWWDAHRHLIAPEIAARIAALQNLGRLRLLAGEIVHAAPAANGVQLQHRGRGGLARHRFEVARIVDCRETLLDLARADHPLLRQLLADGLARPHASGVGFDVDAHGRVLDAAGAPQETMFALGALTQGAFWECTEVPEIRVWAARIAEMLAPPC
jgi:uncharacterized NAD(P)/FAD-binding protein YdhS